MFNAFMIVKQYILAEKGDETKEFYNFYMYFFLERKNFHIFCGGYYEKWKS